MKKIIKVCFLIVFLLVSNIAFSGCDTYDNFKETFFKKAQEQDKIKIGVLEPKTGADAEFGKEEIEGIELAHQIYHSVLGKEVELVYGDTQSNIYTAETAIQTLVEYKPSVILGPYGEANALVVSDYIEKAKIPSIVVSNKNDLITKNNPYCFRISSIDGEQAVALVRYAKDALKVNRFAVFRQDGDDANGEIANRFLSELSKSYGNGYMVLKNYYGKDEADFTKYLNRIKKNSIQTVFAPVTPSVADTLFTQVEEKGLTNLLFLGSEIWNTDEFLSVMSKHPKIRVLIASDFNPEITQTSASKTLMSMYESKYGKGSKPSQIVASAFDAYLLAIRSIEKANSLDSDAIQSVLKGTEDFEGATGKLTFDTYGNSVKSIAIDTVKNNEFFPMTVIEKNRKE